MIISFFTTGILILLALLAVRRLLSAAQLRRYSVAVDGALFGVCFLILGIHFYERKENAGLLAVGMGATAISKYLYDKNKMGEEN
ncbi:MAG: hypothetical protein EOP53_04705 [Sphingobacteriales bacterium]|nr:MAG: hypothetical protein EOP53_04705 [Sphingobacteriales bacterium]